jgi:hypothetical protein
LRTCQKSKAVEVKGSNRFSLLRWKIGSTPFFI